MDPLCIPSSHQEWCFGNKTLTDIDITSGCEFPVPIIDTFIFHPEVPWGQARYLHLRLLGWVMLDLNCCQRQHNMDKTELDPSYYSLLIYTHSWYLHLELSIQLCSGAIIHCIHVRKIQFWEILALNWKESSYIWPPTLALSYTRSIENIVFWKLNVWENMNFLSDYWLIRVRSYLELPGVF